ncbi:MAG: hypothetical protein NC244_12425 [Alistipes senegalensis]|nr:hypothetical protein [Alistipes senegalensis]
MEDENKPTENIPAENTPENTPEQAEKTYSEQEYNDLKSQLDTAKNTVADYKQKWEKSENDRKAFEHRTKVGGYVKSLGLKDDIYEKHVTDLILEKGLKFDGDTLIDDDNVVNDFKEKYPNAFKSAQPVPEFSASTTGQSDVKDDDAFIRKVMGLK